MKSKITAFFCKFEHKNSSPAFLEYALGMLKSELMDIIINKGVFISAYGESCNKTSNSQRDMKMLKEAGLINFIGALKTGKYIITDKLSQNINQ